MRSKSFWSAAGCILAALGLLPIFSSAAPPAATEKILHTFTGGNDGIGPESDLIFDAAGNLYGTTSYGGGPCKYQGAEYDGCGTVFEFTRSGDNWTEQILHSFKGVDGGFPVGGLIFDHAGNLYGTTYGFQYDEGECGNVFELSPNLRVNNGWAERTLYSFTCGDDGGFPTTDLAFDAQGDLFGMTSSTVFELLPQPDGSWKEVTIHHFAGSPDGAVPSAFLLEAAGDIYGTTMSGGTGKCEYNYKTPGCGIVFRLTSNPRGTWTESVLYNFARGGGFGVNPSGGLLADNANRTVGTTAAGGDGPGTVFELTRTQTGLRQNVAYRFYGNRDGYVPVGKIVIIGDALFGVTREGGSSTGYGTVFTLQRTAGSGWREQLLYSFASGSDGSYPLAGVISDAQGNLYGTTFYGGAGSCSEGCGTLYEITP